MFSQSLKWNLATCFGLVVCGISPELALAQTVASNAIQLRDAAIVDAQVARLDKQLYISPRVLSEGLPADGADQPGQASVPRLAASLTGMHWLGHELDDSLSLAVEQDHWIVKWSRRPEGSSVIVLSFDIAPQLMSEVLPVEPSGDGSVFLPACLAVTVGEKIRYEPQTFKNTVGYWVGKQDSARWQFNISRPASYNVAVLQGCGKNQGGSRARIKLSDELGERAIDFEVLETGHFQNFQWRHLGVIQVDQSGLHSLVVEPVEIAHAALVDIRAIHLVPIP